MRSTAKDKTYFAYTEPEKAEISAEDRAMKSIPSSAPKDWVKTSRI